MDITNKGEKIMKTPMIDDWVRNNPEDAYIYPNGKNICLNLEKCFPKSVRKFQKMNKEELDDMKTFGISRQAFSNKNDHICQYIDYFIEFYDEDKELPMLYFHLKEEIDDRDESLTISEYKELLFRLLFKENNIKANIYRLVEDNYHIDVTVDAKSGRRFNDPDDFTNDDIKRFSAISVMMKIVIPPTEHYISTNNIYNDDILSDLMLELFSEIFYRVGDTSEELEADELWTKLYKFTWNKISKHVNGNKILWEQQCALRGVTESNHLDRMLTKFLLNDNFFKIQFNDNVVSFLKSIIETQLTYTIIYVTYKLTPIKVDNVKGPDGLSSIDKLEQSLVKIDETQVIKAEKALRDFFQKMEEEVGPISQDEIDYYGKYLINSDRFHTDLVLNYFAKDFEGFVELKNMSYEEYIKLVIIAKRKLLKENQKELSWLFSSVTKGKVSNRLLQNAKYTNKLKLTSRYKHLVEDEYSTLKGFKDDYIISQPSRVLNNAYTFVEYDQKELTGEPITFNEDIISDELFIYMDNV